MIIRYSLSLLYCLLTISNLKSSEKLLSAHYVSKTYAQRNLTEFKNSKILSLTIKEAQIELECGKLCGRLEHCLFFVHVGRLCLISMSDTYVGHQLDEWHGKLLPNTNIWLKKDQFYFIGYDTLVNEGSEDTGVQHSLVDLTPVPARSVLISFMYNAGEVNREIRFGVFRRHGNCIYELVHQWITSSYYMGQNEYFTNDFIIEKGYHIGFTFTQGGVIRKTTDSVQRYCASKVIPVIKQQQNFANEKIGYRKYSFQGKLMSF